MVTALSHGSPRLAAYAQKEANPSGAFMRPSCTELMGADCNDDRGTEDIGTELIGRLAKFTLLIGVEPVPTELIGESNRLTLEIGTEEMGTELIGTELIGTEEIGTEATFVPEASAWKSVVVVVHSGSLPHCQPPLANWSKLAEPNRSAPRLTFESHSVPAPSWPTVIAARRPLSTESCSAAARSCCRVIDCRGRPA